MTPGVTVAACVYALPYWDVCMDMYVCVCVYPSVAETQVLFLPCKDKAGGVKV